MLYTASATNDEDDGFIAVPFAADAACNGMYNVHMF
jgi:hypothetical protein